MPHRGLGLPHLDCSWYPVSWVATRGKGREVPQDVEHTVTADGGTFDHPMPPNATFSFTFPKAGSFAYHCRIHPSMKGTVVVVHEGDGRGVVGLIRDSEAELAALRGRLEAFPMTGSSPRREGPARPQ
jgi:hypothetical protein